MDGRSVKVIYGRLAVSDTHQGKFWLPVLIKRFVIP